MNTSDIILEFDRIREMLCQEAVSEEARRELSQLEPYLSQRECRRKMQETTEARRILDSAGNPPLPSMRQIEPVIGLCQAGAMLTPSQLELTAAFAASCKRVRSYLRRAESLGTEIAFYGQSICDLSELQDEIEKVVSGDIVVNTASPALRNIRESIEKEGSQIKKKLTEILQKQKSFFTGENVTLRNGRYVVPVKKEFKNRFEGTVIDVSGTGGTYFMEPNIISTLQDKINLLKIEEENEVRRILYTLTALVDTFSPQIRLNTEAMVTLDVIFARAKLSADMDAVPVFLDAERRIQITQGRHPLLKRSECVPLDFSIGDGVRGIVITGPNTGGKTVALKTVGLLSMMAQSGLHVPVKEGRFSMNNLILCDIGDGQSIEQNLSTFSAHITNIIKILENADGESLVLLDELGSGTDPAEGMGIAVSILEELRKKNCLFVATTHYPEVKEYAAEAEGLLNAKMAFDRESLKPLYRLELGEAGESCALYIAKRLGFPGHMLKRARLAAYRQNDRRNDRSPRWELLEMTDNAAGLSAAAGEADEGKDSRIEDRVRGPRIEKERPPKKKDESSKKFQVGDCVTVYPEKSVGIVFSQADETGCVGVQIKGGKHRINHKRLKMKIAAAELYPEDYDMSIVFDSVESRKVRHQMERKYTKGLILETD